MAARRADVPYPKRRECIYAVPYYGTLSTRGSFQLVNDVQLSPVGSCTPVKVAGTHPEAQARSQRQRAANKTGGQAYLRMQTRWRLADGHGRK